MPPVDFFERVGNLADRGPRTRSVDGKREQVAGILLCCLGQGEQGLLACFLVPTAAHLLEPTDLGLPDRRIIDVENVDL